MVRRLFEARHLLEEIRHLKEHQRAAASALALLLKLTNRLQYMASYVVSGSIKKLLSIDYVNIYLFSIFFFNRLKPVEKCGVTPHCLYRDSLTLKLYFHLPSNFVYMNSRKVLGEFMFFLYINRRIMI